MSYVLPPFDTAELIDVLVKAGYIRMAPPTPPGRSQGVRFSFTGLIARKGEVVVDVNDERGVLGAASPSPTLTIDGFNEVLQLIKNNLKADPEITASFFELIGHLEVETQVNPLEKIGRISEKVKLFEEFSKTMGEDVSIYSLRLTPKGQIPDQTEWFDITVEPSLMHTKSAYNISVVYRSKDRPKVQKFIQEFVPTIASILDAIENE
jgi:hypothetical protein